MSHFFKRNPNASRTDALIQARNFLAKAEPFNDNENLFFFQAATLFLTYQDDNELSMSGQEEITKLAKYLEELTFQAAIYEGINNGLFIPSVDEDNELCLKAIPQEEFAETGVSSEVQAEYKQLKDNYFND